MPRMRRIPAAEAMPVWDETRQFIQQVRRTTRRKFTAEEVRIVLEGFRRATQSQQSVNQPTHYARISAHIRALDIAFD